MFDLIGTIGGGVSTNLLSDKLIKKLEVFRETDTIKQFVQHLHDWQIELEQQNDGTVITTGAFCAYFRNYHVIERVVNYFLEPLFGTATEEVFLNDLRSKIETYLTEALGKELSPIDSALIHDSLVKLFAMCKEFLSNQISLENRGLLYLLCQNNSQLDQLEQILKEKFQMEEQTISFLQDQLSAVLNATETEDFIKEQLFSWNSSQIKNLGNRYNPDLNIPLDLTDTLQGASISIQFKNQFLEQTDQFLISVRQAGSVEIQEKCDAIEKIVTGLNFFNITADDIDLLVKLTEDIQDSFSRKIDEYHKSEDDKALSSRVYQLYQGQAHTDDFSSFLLSAPVQASISPYIVLTGDGGAGKSHLIADYVNNQNMSGQASFLLLGQQFSAGTDVLSKLPNLLGCNITYHEFFNTLESIALGQERRLLICIDALNEGAGVTFWNNTLAGLVDFLQAYPHLGLLVSIRTQYEQALFDRQDRLRSIMLCIEHRGFSTVAYEAMHRYFSFYGITTDSVIFPDTEFSNPLFLSLFCKSHQNSHICMEKLSLPSVYAQYIDFEEGEIAAKCGYHKSYKLISKIMNDIILKRVSEQDGAVRLPLDIALKLIVDIKKQWDVSSDVYSALLSEGVLTQSMNYDGDEYVYITYERLEDFFLAEKIAKAYTELPKDQFLVKYCWVVRRLDLLQFFGIILAEKASRELREVFSSDNPWDMERLRDAFLYGLRWRKASSFTAKTAEYIDSEILCYDHSFCQFVDTLFALSTRADHPLNAEHAFYFFQNLSMPDRDADFIPIFDELYGDPSSALSHLLEWGLNYSRAQDIPNTVAADSAIILSWLLISSNNELRDKATKAIICILISHIDALITVLKLFEKIDDPYIAERLYCSAFGCVVNESSPENVRKLAEYVYTTIFDQDMVYPNILLRTYAKNIVDYAYHIGCVDDTVFDAQKTIPPYSSQFPEIPSDEEIKGYKLDCEGEGIPAYYWEQNVILNSMKVEYSRDGEPGGYGDFGRYIFQAYFSAWKQLHPMDLKNIAIKRIFELGYDVEKHGLYDRNCVNHIRFGTQPGKRERIGKKYQWIAFYELAAQVSDHYKMLVYDNEYGDCHYGYCRGSFEPNIRNIDPTVLPRSTNLHSEGHRIPYVIPGNSYEEWLENFACVPSFQECVTLQYEGQPYLLLSGDYNWTEPKHLGVRSYEFPQKNMWYKICGYFVRSEYTDDLLRALSEIDLMGYQMPDLQYNSEMFNKEYYWSDANAFFKNPYYGNSDWVKLYEDPPLFGEEIMIPIRQYYSERKGELNTWDLDASALYWYKPCEEIYTDLHLHYAKDSNSLFVDAEGNPVCFDSSEFLGVESGFYIRQDKLLEFLNMHNYTLVWTFLSEKRILSSMRRKWKLPLKAIHSSSIYYLKNGKPAKVSEKFFEDKLFL